MPNAVVVRNRKVRYAVAGIGWISQTAFLPGVEHTGNSEVVAFVSGLEDKAAKVGEKYGVRDLYSYESEESFRPTDQFGGELKYFSDCILTNKDPEANGEEGLLDIRVIAAVERALETGQPQQLEPYVRKLRPTAGQVQELRKSMSRNWWVFISRAKAGEGQIGDSSATPRDLSRVLTMAAASSCWISSCAFGGPPDAAGRCHHVRQLRSTPEAIETSDEPRSI